MQTLYLFPERWDQLQKNKETGSAGDWGQAFDGEREMPVTDYDEMNKFYNGGSTGDDLGAFYRHIEQPRQMSGAEALLGYAPPGATGRRV